MHKKLTPLCTLLIGACAHDPQPTAAEAATAQTAGITGSAAAGSGVQASAGTAGSSVKAIAGSGGAATTRMQPPQSPPAATMNVGGAGSGSTMMAAAGRPDAAGGGGAGMPAARLPAAGVPAAGVAAPAADSCKKGELHAADVVFIGESFIAQTGAIPRLVSGHARDAGTIAASESYRSFAVSGTQLTTDEIPMQYTRAKAESPVKVVLMDGGGNDLLFGGHCNNGPSSCQELLSVVQDLFTMMGSDGVKDVLYFFYPDPMGIGAQIKDAMDILRPEMQKLCAASVSPRCVWVDQRESWEGHYDEYTSDGIHPTEAGAAASAKQIWQAMQDHCIAQ